MLDVKISSPGGVIPKEWYFRIARRLRRVLQNVIFLFFDIYRARQSLSPLRYYSTILYRVAITMNAPQAGSRRRGLAKPARVCAIGYSRAYDQRGDCFIRLRVPRPRLSARATGAPGCFGSVRRWCRPGSASSMTGSGTRSPGSGRPAVQPPPARFAHCRS